MPTTRFVILHHQEAPHHHEDLHDQEAQHDQKATGEHWDLMIEETDALATWRLERCPRANDTHAIAAVRIGDHRKAYLTYEGPLTQDRGSVTRVAEGACEILSRVHDAWRIVLKGKALHGHYTLNHLAKDHWEFARVK